MQSSRPTISEDNQALLVSLTLIASAIGTALSLPGKALKGPVFHWKAWSDLIENVLAPISLLLTLGIGLSFLLLMRLVRTKTADKGFLFLRGFFVIFGLAWLSLVIAGQQQVSALGLEYVVFALLFGLLAGNLFRLPHWIREAARSELFIKTGLVILGSSVLFTDIVKAGIPGVLQSVLVVLVVWFFALWLSRKLKVDDEFGVILASAVSICGVSAAIVASGAIQGDKKKLSYVTTLVLMVAIPMMVLQPWLIRVLGIPELVGGAWLGGTLDTTASVTAAAELVGPVATKAGVIVKFSQNVLIGIAAFLIASWWVIRNKARESDRPKASISLIWERFPKFVLGFIGVSLLFSFVVPAHTGKSVSGILNSLRTIWFALAFVSIGIEARFADLLSMQQGRPAIAFIIAQVFNILWTLVIAWLLFGGILFDVPNIQ